jgi:hypothetical protein
MEHEVEQPDSPTVAPAPEAAATDAPASHAARRSGMLLLLAGGAAVAGAALTMAFLGRVPPAEHASPVSRIARSAPPPSRRAAAPTVLPRWNQAHEERWISNHARSVAYEIDAIAPVAVWMRHVRPTLVVRCLARSTDVFVFTDSAARIEPRDENHTVRLGFDDGPDATERWPDSADHDALFAPDGRALADRIARARSMRFAFTPHNADAVVAEFDVAGFEAIASTIAKTCGWR